MFDEEEVVESEDEIMSLDDSDSLTKYVLDFDHTK